MALDFFLRIDYHKGCPAENTLSGVVQAGGRDIFRSAAILPFAGRMLAKEALNDYTHSIAFPDTLFSKSA